MGRGVQVAALYTTREFQELQREEYALQLCVAVALGSTRGGGLSRVCTSGICVGQGGVLF